MDETRKHTRRHTPFYLKVFEKGTNNFTGSLADLTVSGMKIFAWQSMSTGVVFQCELTLPDDARGRTQIDLEARCMWCKKYDKSDLDYFEIGFEFVSVSDENHATVETAMEKFFFKGEGVGPVGEKVDTVVE
jgi:hypothetical protein